MKFDWDLHFGIVQLRFGYTPDQIRRLTFYQFFVVCLGLLKKQESARPAAPARAPAPAKGARARGPVVGISVDAMTAQIEAIRLKKKAEGLI